MNPSPSPVRPKRRRRSRPRKTITAIIGWRPTQALALALRTHVAASDETLSDFLNRAVARELESARDHC